MTNSTTTPRFIENANFKTYSEKTCTISKRELEELNEYIGEALEQEKKTYCFMNEAADYQFIAKIYKGELVMFNFTNGQYKTYYNKLSFMKAIIRAEKRGW